MQVDTQEPTYESGVARNPVPTHGFDFGFANAAPGAENRYRYPIWGMQHTDPCNGPMAYQVLGATMEGRRPYMRVRMNPHGSGPLFPIGGQVKSPQMMEPRIPPTTTAKKLPKGTPTGTATIPPVPCPGRNNVVLNVVPGMVNGKKAVPRGFLVGASDSFDDQVLQVPMASPQMPMTPPVFGTPLTAAF